MIVFIIVLFLNSLLKSAVEQKLERVDIVYPEKNFHTAHSHSSFSFFL